LAWKTTLNRLAYYGICRLRIHNALKYSPLVKSQKVKIVFLGWHSLEVHGSHHPQPQLHDEGRPPLPGINVFKLLLLILDVLAKYAKMFVLGKPGACERLEQVGSGLTKNV